MMCALQIVISVIVVKKEISKRKKKTGDLSSAIDLHRD